MSDHDEIQGLIAAYALGALDPEELRLVQAHLPGCAACRRELAGYLRVTDQLALGAAEASLSSPPPGLEERIIREATHAMPARMPRFAWIRNPGLAAAAAVLIFALAAGNVAQWVRSPQFQAETKGLVTVALTGSGEHQDAYGTIVVDKQDSEGVLAVRGLPKLGPDLRYQLWLKRDGETRSGGLFAVNDDGYGSLLIKVPGGFKDFRAFSISVEPAEGSASPKGSAILNGGL
jgi:anti-sigma-K factor RskA